MITYKDSGVNIEEGYKSVNLIKSYAEETMLPFVLNSIGSFAGMVEIPEGYKRPVLVSGTDGVGTKLDIAFRMKKYDTVGIDCVAMCVNDILCHGAMPLYFLDYIACGKLEADVAASLVKGVADGCIQAGCSLIGGETAEMPGFYPNGEYDIAGFAAGIVEKEEIINGSSIKEGDVLIGITSSGLHSNGYSLIRKIIPDLDMPFGNKTIGEVLLTPTKIYVKPILELIQEFKIKGMAHITGGGFIENIPRMFRGNFTAVINTNSYPLPELFQYINSLGVDKNHMYNTFNMGIGFVLCAAPEDAEGIIKSLISKGETAYKIGVVAAGGEGICIE